MRIDTLRSPDAANYSAALSPPTTAEMIKSFTDTVKSLMNTAVFADSMFNQLSKDAAAGNVNQAAMRDYNASVDLLVSSFTLVLQMAREAGVKNLPDAVPEIRRFTLSGLGRLGLVSAAAAAAPAVAVRLWQLGRIVLIAFGVGVPVAIVADAIKSWSPATATAANAAALASQQSFMQACISHNPPPICMAMSTNAAQNIAALNNSGSRGLFEDALDKIIAVGLWVGAGVFAYRMYIRYDQKRWPFNSNSSSGRRDFAPRGRDADDDDDDRGSDSGSGSGSDSGSLVRQGRRFSQSNFGQHDFKRAKWAKRSASVFSRY